MEADKRLNRQITIEVIGAMIIMVLVLVGGYLIYDNIKGSGASKNGDFIVDVIDKDAPSQMYMMNDNSGMSTNPYIINITNNGKKKSKYNLFLNINIVADGKIEEYLRVSVDDIVIQNLKEFKQDKDGNYILTTEDLDKGVTTTHRVKVWLSNDSPNNLSGVGANFKFGVSNK